MLIKYLVFRQVTVLGRGRGKMQHMATFGQLRGRRFYSNEEVKKAIGEWLRIQEPDSPAKEFLNSCQDRTNALM